ncbi:MAG: hypothetical protein ABI837_04505, partial [Acidobacteriota bacterium]
ASWTPDTDLPPGRALSWQVTVYGKGGATTILPEPPDPPARFGIVSPAAASEIDAARRARPEDHLLLGLLYARAGILAEAVRELGSHVAHHPDDIAAQRVLQSVEALRAPPVAPQPSQSFVR